MVYGGCRLGVWFGLGVGVRFRVRFRVEITFGLFTNDRNICVHIVIIPER